MRIKFLFILCVMVPSGSMAQIPVEIFAGHEKTTMDIMFFKYFKGKNEASDGHPDRWLFFNRNRASVDYSMTKTTDLPQFGFTEAISYNHEKLKGFAPVLVGQVLNKGIFPKAGIQYAHIGKDMTVFTWLVSETLSKPDIDYFLLFRFTPALSEKMKLFTQIESLNAFPSVPGGIFSFTQRIRLGLSVNNYQFGVGSDFNQAGINRFIRTYNTGVFIRHEF